VTPSLREQYLAILKLEFVKIRLTWFFHLLIPALIALGLVWLHARLNSVSAGGDERYVAGSAMVAAIFSSLNAVTRDTSIAKANGELEQLASLPVARAPVVLALMTLPIAYGIAPVLILVLVGSAALDLHPHFQILGVIALLATQLMLAGVGLMIGLYLPERLAWSLAAALPLSLMLFTPILLTPAELPWVLGDLGSVLPTTLATDVLEHALFGDPGRSDALKVLVIGAVAAVALAAVARLPGWRELD
jgi:ABC-type multidrug transport system permease subunit